MSALAKRDNPPTWFFWLFGAGAVGYGGWLLYQFLFPATEDIMPDDPSTTIIPPALQEEGFRAGRPVGMVQLMTVGPTVMSIPTGQAFLAMQAAAAADGVQLTLVKLSGFRTMAQQVELFKNPPMKNGIPSRVAKPGTSNHQGGVAVDIASASGPPYGPETVAYKWLSGTLPGQTKSAKDFGFDHVEGASVKEPWHWTHLASMLPFV
jgi:hypothetical protein